MAKKPKLVKMVWPELDAAPSEWKTADVHPAEVENMTAAGWRKVDGA